jgi:peptidoglycan/xylan/chitin deacetylase (PgdA/CDA1 family)
MAETPPYDYTPDPERDYDLPGDHTVAAWVVLNVEHFHIDEPYREGDPVPDSKGQGQRDYGTRAGYWRLLDVLDDQDVPATLALNAEVCDHQPRVVEAALDCDWPLMGHGLTNSRRLTAMSPAEQRETIEATRDRIAAVAGEAPAGWLSPSLQSTLETPVHLAEAGFEYLCDYCAGDQPFDIDGDLVGVPYSLDLNDKGLFGRQGLTGRQYRDSLLDACDTLAREGTEPGNARVLPIPLHPHVTGQPFRAPYLEEVLAELTAREEVWLTTGDEIAAHYRDADR